MGDMADDFLDSVIDYEDDVWAYHHGEMTDQEAYERGIIDELGFEMGPED